MGIEWGDLFTRLKREGVVLAEGEQLSTTMIILHTRAVYLIAYKAIFIKGIHSYFLICFMHNPCDLRDIILILQMRKPKLGENKKPNVIQTASRD